MKKDATPLERVFAAAEDAATLVRSIDKLLLMVAEDDDEGRDLGEALFSLLLLKEQIKTTYGTLEELITERVHEGLTLQNGALLEVKGGAPRKSWDHDRLAQEVARRIVDSAFDMDTGELRMSFHDMVTAMLRYAAPSYWRVTQLAELGIDPDQYCEKGEYKKSVVVRKGSE